MEDRDNGSAENWLKKEVVQRGPERLKEGARKVFDRVRVVGTLFAHIKEEDRLSQAELETRAVAIIQKYNHDMEHTIKIASQESRDDPETGFYYVPLSTSDEVIRDGSRWFSELKQIGKGDLKFENVGIDDLVRKLYQVMTRVGFAEEILEKSPGNLELGGLVSSMVGEKHDTPIITPVGDDEGWPVARGLNVLGARLEQAQENLVEWMGKIGPDINRLYAETMLSASKKE